jgi:hypothetical protein
MAEPDPWAERAEKERQEWLYSKSLDAAWAEAEAALPEGWRFRYIAPAMYTGDNLPPHLMWFASATPRGWFDFLGPYVEGVDDDCIEGIGPTPAAALRALAATLRERSA